MKQHTVTICGGGEMGACLARVLTARGHAVRVWDIDERKRSGPEPQSEMFAHSDVVFLAVCSWHAENALAAMRGLVKPDALVVSVTKGMTQDGKTMDTVIARALPNRFVLLSGPMVAESVCDDKLGFAVAAGTRDDFDIVSALFSGTNIRLEYASDVRSVAWAGILKNVYALFMGMADACDVGDNAKGYFISRILEEWDALAGPLRLNRAVLRGRAGQGDFFSTSISAFSKNRAFGENVVRGGSEVLESEGARSLAPFIAAVRKATGSLPAFLEALENAVIKKQDAKAVVSEVMNQKT